MSNLLLQKFVSIGYNSQITSIWRPLNAIPSVTISIRNAKRYGRKILNCLLFLQYTFNSDKILGLISCEYIGEGSVNRSMKKRKNLEKINFFTYFRYGRNFTDGKLTWKKSQ